MNRCRFFAIVSASAVTATSLICLAGYFLDSPSAAALFISGVPMAPSTAVCFLLSGGAVLAFWSAWPRSRTLPAVAAAGVLVALTALGAIVRFIRSLPLTAGGSYPLWTMSPVTAALFVVVAASFWRLSRGRAAPDRPAAILSAALLAAGCVLLTAYLYGEPLFYGGAVIPAAFSTAAAFCALGAALLASFPASLASSAFFGDSLRATLLRNFIPLVMFAVLMDRPLDVMLGAFLDSGALIHLLNMALAVFAGVWLTFRIATRVDNTIHQVRMRAADNARRFREERRITGGALRDSETMYRTLFEQARDAILLLEPRPEGAPLIRDVNDAALQMHGYEREELIGRPITCLDTEESAALVAERQERLRKAGQAIFEAFHKRKDGTVFTMEVSVKELEISGRPVILDISRDITQRRLAEADSRENYEIQGLLNAMLHNSLSNLPLRAKLERHLTVLTSVPWLPVYPKGAVFLVGSGGRQLVLAAGRGLTDTRAAVCAKIPFGNCLCGRTAESGLAMISPLCAPVYPRGISEGSEPHGHCCVPIIAGEKVLGVLNLYLKQDSGLTLRQQQFLASAAGVIAGDVVHSQAEEKFLQAQKMEAVGRLAGGVAHDFNNILSGISCYADFLVKGIPPGDPRHADAKEISAAAVRAASLTRQLLAFSRRQMLSLRVTDVNGLVSDMARMLTRIIGEHVKISVKLHPEPCPAQVDPGQMEQVVMNLAVNARDAMPRGGNLALETEVIIPPGEYFAARPEIPKGRLVCLKVRDTGCGMDESVKSRLFEPFFTTKEPGRGTGLGLSMVFGVVKQFRGDIEVESEPGKGSQFAIYLPFAKERPAPVPEAGGGLAPPKGRETVLFVEDDGSLRRLGERVLRETGYTVLVAADGQEAIRLMERHGRPVDLLITDVVMPGMTGRELAAELARRNLVRRTLYMSGYAGEATVNQGIPPPEAAFINKPFNLGGITRKIREVLDNPAEEAKT